MIIHIGGNKTGSTLLQRRLFSKHSLICYLGEECEGYSKLRPLLDSLVADDDSHFDYPRVKEIFSDRFSKNNKASCVYSNEDIMTSPLPSVCANRLKCFMPDAKIVMVIRNQLTTWLSWYANHGAFLKNVPRRYWRKYVGLEEWLEYCFRFPNRTPVEAMNYERFFNIFRDRFSENQIYVLLYEDLLTDPHSYYGQWAELLGISPNDIVACLGGYIDRGRNSQRRLYYNRCISKLSSIIGFNVPQSTVLERIPAFSNWLDSGKPTHTELPDIWKTQIADYYRKSNTDLVNMTGLDLARYNYPL